MIYWAGIEAKYSRKILLVIKYAVLLCFTPIFLHLAGCDKATNADAVKHLKTLLDQKEYFKLQTQFRLFGSNIGDKDRLYFKSFIDNAFNRNYECITDVDSLLKNNSLKLSDSLKPTLYRLQSDSYFKTYQYAKAANNDNILLKNCARILTKADIDDINYDLVRFNALKKVPPQQTIIKSSTSIPWKKDKIGLIEITVTSHAQNFNGIFDTRANISSITQTYAKKLGLRILNATYDESSGATGITFKTGIGIADSLLIGNIVVRNAVFQVMPDSILYIAPIRFQLNIILGFPVIEQLQEVDLFKDGRMVIPLTPSVSNLHNFALDGLDPVISLKSGKDTLSFHFDSGAITSDLYSAYFEKYKNLILKTGVKKYVEIGGAGGSQKKKVYVLPGVSLFLGDTPATIDSIIVFEKKTYPNQILYGNLGQDFMANFSELVFNFKYMYVKGVK
jgi:hypothetical protein